MVRSPNRALTPAEKSTENAHFIFCNPFQNLRLGTIQLEGGREIAQTFGRHIGKNFTYYY